MSEKRTEGYVIRWPGDDNSGWWWFREAMARQNKFEHASVMSLSRACYHFKSCIGPAEIVRVRRVAGEMKWENVPLQGLYWRLNGGAMHRLLEIPHSFTPNQDITLDRAAPGAPRWEIVEEEP